MPQEDGVSVQQGLVSAALRRLQGEHRTGDSYNMLTPAPPNTRRSRRSFCNHFQSVSDLWYRASTSGPPLWQG